MPASIEGGRVTISILFHSGCPHARQAVELVHRCVARLGIAIPVHEYEGDHASPTVLVNGLDVMGHPPPLGRTCRLDMPTEARVLDALRHASDETL